MKLTVLDLQSQEKLETLRARGRNFFRCLIDPDSTEVMEKLVQRRQKAGDTKSSEALQESLDVCRKIQSEIASFPEEVQERLLPLLDLISEEIFLSVCTYHIYDLEYQQAMLEDKKIPFLRRGFFNGQWRVESGQLMTGRELSAGNFPASNAFRILRNATTTVHYQLSPVHCQLPLFPASKNPLLTKGIFVQICKSGLIPCPAG